jgi:Amt family ammonium transporter
VFASKFWGGTDGLLHGASEQLWKQFVGVGATIVYTVVVTWVLFIVIDAVAHARAKSRDEATGLDVSQHGEEGYTDGEGAILVLPSDAPDLRRAG